jgi:hypothetical protein
MSEKLRPCPFCGEMPKVNNWTLKGITDKRCFCDNENCPVYLSKTIAIDDWNTRPIEDALTARIAELEAAQKEALSLLPKLERGHYYCDDCWYSCPKAVDGCCDERQGDECDCGADDYNAILAKIIGLLTSEVQE